MHAYDIHQSVWSCLTLSPDLGATTLFSAVAPYWYGSEDGAWVFLLGKRCPGLDSLLIE